MPKKFIVVTGGSQGIGRSVVEKFSAEGFDVAVCSRNSKTLNSLCGEIEKKFAGISIKAFSHDLSVKNEALQFAEEVIAWRGAPDILVNNAGQFAPGNISDEPEGTMEQMIAVNLYSAYNTTRGFLHAMKAQKKGHIFNMCSIASLAAYENGGSYAVSKAALLSFSRCLRQELMEYRIRVTALLPGATLTASWEGAGLPKSRFIKTEDIAEVIFSAYNLSVSAVVEEIIIRPLEGDI